MSVPVQHPMYIDGQFVTWRGDAWIDVVNPATEVVISRIPDGQAEDARKAIDAAERAQPEWEALPAIERASWLRKISAGIRERATEISALIVEEGGKIQQLAEVEVAFTADYIDYMAEWARRYEGEIYSAAIFLIPVCISFDTAEKRRYATYLILNRRFSFKF